MHQTRAPASARPSISFSASSALALVVMSLVAPVARAQTSPVRAIVLSFEGWRAEQARAAVAAAIGREYTLVTEEEAIFAAARIGADVSTPEGMAAVVQHLAIDLVVGGSVAGTGRRSSTTIFVLDRNGNELATATAPGPAGRTTDGPIAAAALGACARALEALRPSPQPEPQPRPEPRVEPTRPVEPEPPMRSIEDIENERPGQSRQSRAERWDPERDESRGGERAGRWNQPLFRGLAQLDFRNRSALIRPVNAAAEPGNFADFYPQLGLVLETRPMAGSDDALRGLYGRLDFWFSAGINYYSNLDEQPLPLQVFGVEVGLGYAGTIAEAVELIGTVGFGYDTYTLTLPAMPSDLDLPSTAYPYIPITVQGRIRLLPSDVSDVDLHLEALVGPRIVLGGGGIAGTPETNDYFQPRSGLACGTGMPTAACNGDFGAVSGAALNVQAGLGLIVNPGFSAALRFQYVNYFLGFSGGSGTRQAASGTDESIHFQILAGWSFR